MISQNTTKYASNKQYKKNISTILLVLITLIYAHETIIIIEFLINRTRQYVDLNNKTQENIGNIE